VFLAVAIEAKPGIAALAEGSIDIAWRDPNYLYLVAANIGAVIMPWMVFYQQSSVVEKKLTVADLGTARIDTGIGAVLTQIIMAAVLASTAATLGGVTQSGSPRHGAAERVLLSRHLGIVPDTLHHTTASCLARRRSRPIWAKPRESCCSASACRARPWWRRSSSP